MASFSWFVSLRYLRAKRKQKFISLITLISILGVAVGVMALIVVLAVYTGFTEGLRDQIIGINSHVIIQSYGGVIEDPEDIMAKAASAPGVTAQTPVIYTQALITSPAASSGVALRGIEPETVNRVSAIGDKIILGSLESLNPPDESEDEPAGPPAIVVGRELARQLKGYTIQ